MRWTLGSLTDERSVTGGKFAGRAGVRGRDLLHDISFTLPCHACLGIVGESGSGKSLTCRALMGLLGGQFTRSGLAWLDGADLLAQDAEAMRRLRGKPSV